MKFCTVDAFTDKLFHGNPAAVCVVDAFPDDELMQNIATEVNLSETAFVLPRYENHYEIRWFTPTIEVNLCGHATLAAAHVLWTEMELVNNNEIYFESKSGILKANKNQTDITLDFPAQLTEPTSIPDGLIEALGISPVFVGRSFDECLVELHSEEEVMNLNPDISLLSNVDCRGVIVTAEGSGKYDFVSRFFAPRDGIPEDPVTGSAHCKLAPYWSSRLERNDFIAYQASKRGGVLKVSHVGERVLLTGQAVTAFSGRFLAIQNI
jgi:PhzF family phenazine biosynthesis protein